MPAKGTSPFATFLIIGPVCFFLGILFALFPYDYHVLWTTPSSTPPALAATLTNALPTTTSDPRATYFALQENHLRFLHASPPLISRILHIVIGTGILGFMLKLYKPSEANMLFDGASLALYMSGITVYIANIVKGLRTVTAGAYGGQAVPEGESIHGKVLDGTEGDFIGREDSLRVLAASNTILALVLVGVLVLQAGQWYAQRKETEEMEDMDKADEKRAAAKAMGKEGGGKKKQ
ncbi:Protein csh3 [Friedmanniomyces endolithicus]|nr:Protein csh3 [Friedmanniomyces endolithicus]